MPSVYSCGLVTMSAARQTIGGSWSVPDPPGVWRSAGYQMYGFTAA